MEEQTIIVDNGSGLYKAGLEGTCFPSFTIPKSNVFMNGSIRYPVDRGLVHDWDDMEKVWNYTFDILKAEPKNHPILITETPLNPRRDREKMTQIMFETFNCHSFYTSIPGVLSLYSSCRTNGLVLDSGYGVSSVIPVYEGFTLTPTITKNEIGGSDVNLYLMNKLKEKHFQISEKEIQSIKEQSCYVSLDFEKEITSSEYRLPDGQMLNLGRERIESTELLFNKDITNNIGLQDLLKKTIDKIDPDIQQEFYSNIILSGGNTLFNGFSERLLKELHLLVPTSNIKIISPRDRKSSVWFGGSILSSLSKFKEMLISKQEYEETGSVIVHRKCF